MTTDGQVRMASSHHYSEQEILLAFQCKFAELSSSREEGQQDLHEAYQVMTRHVTIYVFRK